MDDDSRRPTEAEMQESFRKLRKEMNRPTMWNWMYRRHQRFERAFVHHDVPAVQRMLWAYIAQLLVTCACIWSVTAWSPGAEPLWAMSVVVAMVVLMTRGSYNARRQAGAYRSGWIEGRQDAVRSLAEARQRGLVDDEWLTAVLERDMSVIW